MENNSNKKDCSTCRWNFYNIDLKLNFCYYREFHIRSDKYCNLNYDLWEPKV